MTPLPVIPKIVVEIDPDGKVVQVASNIAPVPELVVEVARGHMDFNMRSAGLPFVQSLLKNGKPVPIINA